jgi:hypothetical protein
MWVLVPLFLVLVLVLAIGSLFAGVFWLLGSTWPWLLIALGAWMFWHEDGRHRHRARGRPDWSNARVPVQDGSRSRPKEAAPRRALQKAELPIDVQVKVEQIRRKVDVLLGYADRFPPFSQDLYLVRQTASDYLPRTVNAYLSLPPEAVDKPLAHAAGRTPRQELRAQLDLLDSKLDDIAQDLQRQDADRLLANRRFLEDRFGSREESKTQQQLSA